MSDIFISHLRAAIISVMQPSRMKIRFMKIRFTSVPPGDDGNNNDTAVVMLVISSIRGNTELQASCTICLIWSLAMIRFQRQRSLAGYGPRGRTESATTEATNTFTFNDDVRRVDIIFLNIFLNFLFYTGV